MPRPPGQQRTVFVHEAVVPVFRGIREADPVFFAESLWPAVMDLADDAGQAPDEDLGNGMFARVVGGRSWVVYQVTGDVVNVLDFEFFEP